MLGQTLALWDVENVESFCNGVLEDELRRKGAWLDANKREEALAYLIATVYELSCVYDPGRSTQSFSTYSYRIARLRVTDFYRASMGDRRYGKDVKPLSLDVESDEDEQRSVITAEVERQMLNLHWSFLQPWHRRALRLIVYPRWCLHTTYKQIHEETNWTHKRLKHEEAMCLNELGFTVHGAMA